MNTRIKSHSNLNRNNLADVCGLLRHDQFSKNQIACVSGLALSVTTRLRRLSTGRISHVKHQFWSPEHLTTSANSLRRNCKSTGSERQDRVVVSHARLRREVVYFELSRRSGGMNLQAID